MSTFVFLKRILFHRHLCLLLVCFIYFKLNVAQQQWTIYASLFLTRPHYLSRRSMMVTSTASGSICRCAPLWSPVTCEHCHLWAADKVATAFSFLKFIVISLNVFVVAGSLFEILFVSFSLNGAFLLVYTDGSRSRANILKKDRRTEWLISGSAFHLFFIYLYSYLFFYLNLGTTVWHVEHPGGGVDISPQPVTSSAAAVSVWNIHVEKCCQSTAKAASCRLYKPRAHTCAQMCTHIQPRWQQFFQHKLIELVGFFFFKRNKVWNRC